MIEFKTDLNNCMKECILSLFWKRSDITKFFVDNGMSIKDINLLLDETNTKRHAIVDDVFAFLSRTGEKGKNSQRAILDSLLQWNYFEGYWYEQKKLDSSVARANILKLNAIVDEKYSLLKKKIDTYSQAKADSQKAQMNIQQIKSKFLELIKDSTKPNQRGFIFEDVLLDLARNSELNVITSFRSNGQQIDGAIKFDGENYMVEAKWHSKELGNESLFQFAGKIERGVYGRGLFFSVNGFTDEAVGALMRGAAMKTILVDGTDLMLVMESHLTFSEMIDAKITAAQTRGEIYIDPVTLKPKVSLRYENAF